MFGYYNANKRGVEIDLTDPDAEAILARLALGTDVIVIAPSVQTPVPGWDAATRTLSWAGADAVVCCLTSFGLGGPHDDRRATHFTSFAGSGMMWAIGPEEGPPRAVPGTPVYDELSAHAAAAATPPGRSKSAD